MQHPVYCVQVVGTQNAYNLISVSTDGKMCSWSLDMLSQPQDSIELQVATLVRLPGAFSFAVVILQKRVSSSVMFIVLQVVTMPEAAAPCSTVLSHAIFIHKSVD